MPNPSFGAIMASAADQSRIAREKDEANQLAMMQAGFVPKEQPPQPEPSGLQSILSSVRDQYAYQPQHAPTDYVPGPGHASSMQTQQLDYQKEQARLLLESEQRFDESEKERRRLTNQGLILDNDQVGILNANARALQPYLHRDKRLEGRQAQADYDKTVASTAGTRAQTEYTQALTGYKRLEGTEAKARFEDWKKLSGYRDDMRDLAFDKVSIEVSAAGVDFMTHEDGTVYMANFVDGTILPVKGMGGDPTKMKVQIGGYQLEAVTRRANADEVYRASEQYKTDLKQAVQNILYDPEVEALAKSIQEGVTVDETVDETVYADLPPAQGQLFSDGGSDRGESKVKGKGKGKGKGKKDGKFTLEELKIMLNPPPSPE